MNPIPDRSATWLGLAYAAAVLLILAWMGACRADEGRARAALALAAQAPRAAQAPAVATYYVAREKGRWVVSPDASSVWVAKYGTRAAAQREADRRNESSDEWAARAKEAGCCSPACTCGCVQGEPCGCAGDRAGRARERESPASSAAPAPRRTHAPAPPAAVLVPYTYGYSGYVTPQRGDYAYGYGAPSPAYYQPARWFAGSGRRGGGSC